MLFVLSKVEYGVYPMGIHGFTFLYHRLSAGVMSAGGI